MNVTPTPGIAAAWSAAKAAPNQQNAQAASQLAAGKATEADSEAKKTCPAPEGQGTRVDVQI